MRFPLADFPQVRREVVRQIARVPGARRQGLIALFLLSLGAAATVAVPWQLGRIVDIVITHEPSAKVKEFLQMQFTEKSRVTLLNTYFEELAGAVDYRKWYFGSLHMDKHISATQVAVFTNVLEAWTGKPI